MTKTELKKIIKEVINEERNIDLGTIDENNSVLMLKTKPTINSVSVSYTEKTMGTKFKVVLINGGGGIQIALEPI